jgi:hypothetical protein
MTVRGFAFSATRRVAKKVAGGRSPRRPPECEIKWVAPRRGARSFAVKIFYVDLTSGTPSGCGHD